MSRDLRGRIERLEAGYVSGQDVIASRVPWPKEGLAAVRPWERADVAAWLMRRPATAPAIEPAGLSLDQRIECHLARLGDPDGRWLPAAFLATEGELCR